MRYSVDLLVPSSQKWLNIVLNNFDTFLQDHADCERKASSMAMSLIAKYPDRNFIIPELIKTAIEELEHFQNVYDLIKKRGGDLAKSMSKDQYVQELMTLCQGGTPKSRFMNRLLVASIIECRGCERFKQIAENIKDLELKKFYKMLWISEAKHGNIFVLMALHYFDQKIVYDRLAQIVEKENQIIKTLPLRAALH